MSKGSRASVCECKWLACSNTGLLDAESRLDITTRGTFLESCDWTGHALASAIAVAAPAEGVGRVRACVRACVRARARARARARVRVRVRVSEGVVSARCDGARHTRRVPVALLPTKQQENSHERGVSRVRARGLT